MTLRHVVQGLRSLPLVMLVVIGCTSSGYDPPPPPPPQPPSPRPVPPPPRSIGILFDVSGPNAFYVRNNRGPVARSIEGQPVFEGDRIFTGPNSRMSLRLVTGATVELFENTDPIPRFLTEFRCWIIDVLVKGMIFVEGNDICVGALGTITKQQSQVVYDVRSGRLQITVVSGQAEIRRPQVVRVPAGSRADATAKTVVGGKAYPLTKTEVARVVSWTRWFRQTKPSVPQLPGTLDPKTSPRR